MGGNDLTFVKFNDDGWGIESVEAMNVSGTILRAWSAIVFKGYSDEHLRGS